MKILRALICCAIMSLCFQAFADQTIQLKGNAGGQRFDGIGAVSGGGATSVLLKDYPEPQRSQVLDYLFKPKFGASISALFVEVPGDGNSTQGAEPSHMHSRTDENYYRGYEWWLMTEAKKRNPLMTLDGVAWSCPFWVGNNIFWSQDMCDYYVKWIKGLRSEHGLDLDAIGCRNEKGVNEDFIKRFRATLNANGLERVKLHGFDNWQRNKFDWVRNMITDPVLKDAVDIVGNHTMVGNPTPADVRKMLDEMGKPVWNTEEHVYKEGFDCEISLVQAFNKNFLESGVTKIVNWYLVASIYEIEPYPETPAIMVAREPWSGSYYTRPVLWGYAHYGQFSQAGWQYLNGACGNLTGGGTYVTLKSPGSDYSIIAETKDAGEAQKVTLNISGGLSNGKLCVWRSNASEQFVRLDEITPVNGTFTVTLEPMSIYSFSTTTGQQKGSFAGIPASKPFPFPYYETFDGYKSAKSWGYLPHYMADISGIFEIVDRPDKTGKCLRQVISEKAQSWAPEWMPYTILGDKNWKDYEVSVDVYLDNGGWSGVMGRVSNTGNGYGCNPKGYYIRLATDGTCSLYMAVQARGRGAEAVPAAERLLATGKAANIADNQWHNLKLQFSGSTITGFVDQTQVLTATDTSLANGMAGLVTGGENDARNTALFDNLIVNTVNGPTPKPTEFAQNDNPIYKPSEAAIPISNPREIIPFDTDWRFRLGDESAAKQPNFDDTSWRTLDVPHDWSIEGPINPPPDGEGNGGFFSHGIGWYRKSFSLPASAGKKVVIEFDGVYMNSDVWINGHFLGRKPYGFVGFRYDLTEFLKTDGTPNILAVRVDDSAEPSTRWYSGSGIYRHVRLITTGYTHFRLDGGVSITTPEVSPEQAVVEVNYTIDANFLTDEERLAWLKDVWKARSASSELVLRSAVLAPDGSVVASAESKLTLESMHPGYSATQRVTVPKPSLWSDSTPKLYRLRSTLALADRTFDETTTMFGIRRLEFDPDRGMFVNGKSTKLKGVCLHQDAGSFGNAVPTAVWAMRLALLKEMGCNAVRTSHHPFAPEFYDLCDQLGIYVFDEAFDEWTRDWAYNYTENPRGKAPYGYHLYFKQWHETDLRAMLRRDRNHPSVVLYSIGNEVPDQLNRDGFKIAKELVNISHEEDPTRPATSGCDQSFVSSRNGFMDVLDIGGYNYIDRLYGDRTYALERARFPKRLFLGTETGSDIHYWLGVRNNDYVIGDFIWTGIDYLGETRFPRRGNGSGFIDFAGGKKTGFYQRAAYWRNDPVLHLSVSNGQNPDNSRRGAPFLSSWNWPAVTQVTVRAATNCDEVELFLNERSLGRHAVSHDVYASDWTVAYAPGKLSAVGYRAGKQVATHELQTNGPAARLQITPVPSPVSSDLTLYEITVVDEADLNVLEATPAVSVRIEGPGRLIGLDTGDLSYGGLFKTDTRNAYQGRLLVTVQRIAPGGEIRISAVSPGLSTATARAK